MPTPPSSGPARVLEQIPVTNCYNMIHTETPPHVLSKKGPFPMDNKEGNKECKQGVLVEQARLENDDNME